MGTNRIAGYLAKLREAGSSQAKKAKVPASVDAISTADITILTARFHGNRGTLVESDVWVGPLAHWEADDRSQSGEWASILKAGTVIAVCSTNGTSFKVICEL